MYVCVYVCVLRLGRFVWMWIVEHLGSSLRGIEISHSDLTPIRNYYSTAISGWYTVSLDDKCTG